MSRHFERSPGPKFNAVSPEFGGFRSPIASSPSKMNYGGWRHNTGRFRPHGDFSFSPRGGRRGGGYRRGNGGFHRTSDISAYVNPSMLSDPWKHLQNPLDALTQSTSTVKSPSMIKSPSTSSRQSDESQATEESLISFSSDQTVDLTNDSASEQNQQ